MRGGTGMASPILELGARMGWKMNATQPLHPLERPSIHCTGDCVGLSQSAQVQKISPPPGIKYQTVQLLASRYKQTQSIWHGHYPMWLQFCISLTSNLLQIKKKPHSERDPCFWQDLYVFPSLTSQCYSTVPTLYRLSTLSWVKTRRYMWMISLMPWPFHLQGRPQWPVNIRPDGTYIQHWDANHESPSPQPIHYMH
jgi:hypothetical protein